MQTARGGAWPHLLPARPWASAGPLRASTPGCGEQGRAPGRGSECVLETQGSGIRTPRAFSLLTCKGGRCPWSLVGGQWTEGASCLGTLGRCWSGLTLLDKLVTPVLLPETRTLEKACGPGATPCPGGVHQQETGLGTLDAHGFQPSESQTSKEGAVGKSGFSTGGGAGRGSAPRGLGRQGAWADAEAGFALLESQSFGLCGVSLRPKLAPLWTSGQMPPGGALPRRARVAGLAYGREQACTERGTEMQSQAACARSRSVSSGA